MRGVWFALGRFLNRFAVVLVAFVPVCVLALFGYRAFLGRVDFALRDLTPIVEEEASRALQRPVKIGKIATQTSLARVLDVVRHPDRFADFPIEVESIELGNRPDEIARAGQPWLAKVARASARVSIPRIFAGQIARGGVPLIEIFGAELVLVRFPYPGPRGERFNIEDISAPGSVDPSKPAFTTRVVVENSSVRFRDYVCPLATRGTNPSPEENRLAKISGDITLGETRISGDIAASAAPGTPTARRIGQPLAASLILGRGESRAGNAALKLSGGQLDLAYALAYATRPGDARVSRGTIERFSGSAVLAPNTPVTIVGDARARGIDLDLKAAPNVAPRGVDADLVVRDSRVEFVASGSALGSTLLTRGEIWDIPGLGTVPGRAGAAASIEPKLYARVEPFSVSIARALALAPKTKLPKGLKLSDRIDISGLVVGGSLKSPAASGQIQASRIAFPGVPNIDTARASFGYANNSLAIEGLDVRLNGGGFVRGRGALALALPGGTPSKNAALPDGELSVDFDRVPLARLELLRKIDPKFRPGGLVAGRAIGRVRGGKVDGVVSARVNGATIGALKIPEAVALVELAQSRFALKTSRLAGNWGVVTLTGTGVLPGDKSDGSLSLSGNFVGLDAAKLAALAPGIDGVSGLVSGSVQVGGSFAVPRATLRDLVALRPRFREGNRIFAADAIRASRIETVFETRRKTFSATLVEPLDIARYPARIAVTGRVDGPFSEPKLALEIAAQNVDFDEIARQALPVPARFAPRALQERPEFVDTLRGLGWSEEEKSPVSGTITNARASVSGTIRAPRIVGDASFGRMVFGQYPIESGELSFAVRGRAVEVTGVKLLASVGEISARASLSESGALSGEIVAPSLKLESLNRFTQEIAPVSGTIGLRIGLSGTRESPIVVASVDENSRVRLAGIELKTLSVKRIEARLNVSADGLVGGTIDADPIVVAVAGGSLSIENLAFNLGTHAVSGVVKLTDGRIETLISTLRGARLWETSYGEALVSALRAENLPSNLSGGFSIALTASGRMEGDHFVDWSVGFGATGTDIVIGPTITRSVALEGNLKDLFLTVQRFDVDEIRESGVVGGDEFATIRGSGTVQLPEGVGPARLNLRVESNQAPVRLARAFVKNLPLEGRLDISATVRGTSNAPSVVASIEGENIALLTDEIGVDNTSRADSAAPPGNVAAKATPKARGGGAPAQTAAAPGASVPSGRIVFDRLRATGSLSRNAETNLGQISIRNALLKRGDDSITATLVIPYDYDRAKVDPRAPIDINLKVERIDLSVLQQVPRLRDWGISGQVVGNARVAGTLNAPQLSGDITLADGAVRFPRGPSDRRDPLNPVQSLQVHAALSGNEIVFSDTRLSLGPSPARTKRAGGAIALTGKIRLDNLEDFSRLFADVEETTERNGVARPAQRNASRLRGAYDLKVAFEKFAPDAENLSGLLVSSTRGQGLGEAARGQIDGSLSITGDLLKPKIATAANAPLVLSEAVYQFPSQAGPEATKSAPGDFDPQFDIDIVIDRRARVQGAVSLLVYGFDGTGAVRVEGSLSEPRLQAEITPTGGAFQYAITRFAVQRGGEIRVNYSGVRTSVEFREVRAIGSVNVSSFAASGINGASPVNSGGLQNVAPGTRVRITATLEGQLFSLASESQIPTAPGGALTLDSGNRLIQFSSEPALSQNEILSLLLVRSEIDRLASGDRDQALRSVFDQFTGGYILPRLLGSFTQGLADLLGVDALTIDYAPDGTALFQVTRRLSPPLDRFTVDLRRTLQTRGTGSGLPIPFTYSLTYELVQLRTRSRYPLRLQLGVSINEQRDVFQFLRGTINF